MKSLRFTVLITAGLVLFLTSTARTQPFVRTLGGNNSEEATCVIQASDGGFVATGWTDSYGAGDRDLLLVKFDGSGNHLWTKTLGGDAWDEGQSVIQASDGTFVVTGSTYSFGAGLYDLLLAKFDASGNLVWVKTLGGTDNDGAHSVIEASDGTFVVMGSTYSFGGGVWDNLLLAKFDTSGNFLWMRTAGGYSYDFGYSLIEASNGDLVVAGWTASFSAGWLDLLLARFDPSGNLLWERSFGGGDDYDQGYCVIEVSDGGLVVVGHTNSFGAGGYDLLLAKFDGSGNHLWTKTVGGSENDMGYSAIETGGGQLVVTGRTWSFGVGQYDCLLACFDSSGNNLWTRTTGGAASDLGWSVIRDSNEWLVVTGWTENFGAGGHDLLLARFDPWGSSCLGEFVTPTVQTISPYITAPTPTITTPSPTISSPSPTVTSVSPTITVVCDEALLQITSITDVGNDQGRQVRVKWDRCYWDAVGSPVTITEYSLWRRIDDDKGRGESYFSIPDPGRVYPPGDWDFIKTVPARGESTYSTVCPTLGDSTEAEGMYWSVFFVSAMTADPLVYFDSDPDSGYSLDNIPPLPILDLEIDPNSWFTLEWTVPGEHQGEEPISSYDIRYSTDPVGIDTQTWWDNAEPCTGDGFFNFIVGDEDSFGVAEESGCHPEIYFAIKGLDDRPNASGISNVVHFLCGDDNGDGIVNVGDIVYEVCYLFRNGPAPSPRAAGDVNCDGIENIGDITYKVSYLYRGGPLPCGQ